MSPKKIDQKKRPLSLHVPLKFIVFFILLWTSSSIAQNRTWTGWEIILLSPLVYFQTELIGAFAQLFFCFRGFFVPPLHNHPLAAKDLAEFWGHRWNIWIQDWLRTVTRPLRKNSLRTKILMSFLISGLFHEVMFNLPLWIYSKENYFGTMVLYFLIQGFGLWFEKVYMQHSIPILKRIFMWIIVIAPSPLFLTGSILKLLGISYG